MEFCKSCHYCHCSRDAKITAERIWDTFKQILAVAILAVLLVILLCFSDLGHFQYQSAQGEGISLVCGITAHILTLHCYIMTLLVKDYEMHDASMPVGHFHFDEHSHWPLLQIQSHNLHNNMI